jgi:hypothetical protein
MISEEPDDGVGFRTTLELWLERRDQIDRNGSFYRLDCGY